MSIQVFNSITQYDKIFHQLGPDAVNRGKNFCPFFSLITVQDFFLNKKLSKFVHDQNVVKAVLTHVNQAVYDQLYFTDLISLTDIDKSIVATSVELIKENIIGYSEIFPKEDSSYAVIFLKNGKYFVVMAHDNLFSIRDCHESTQYSSMNRDELIKHLNENYQFNHEIDLDGYKIEEYSNIEFARVHQRFKTSMNFDFSHPLLDKLTNNASSGPENKSKSIDEPVVGTCLGNRKLNTNDNNHNNDNNNNNNNNDNAVFNQYKQF